jgi:hypothetical protein
MPDKKAEQLRKDLASERERLGNAVDDLQIGVHALIRKLPYAAAVVIGVGVVVLLVRRRRSG